MNALRTAETHAGEKLESAGFIPSQIPSAYRERSGQREVKLYSRKWLHPRGLDARCCLIVSSRVEVLNLMIFPWSAESCPIFASEIIVFGNLIRVAVVDHQSANPASALKSQIESELAPLHEFHQSKVSGGGELPEWARAHFTSSCIYSRPRDESETPFLCMAFNDYLDFWAERWLRTAQPEFTASDHLASYLTHHIENTPGRPFLSGTFGKDWAERYFGEFMYVFPSEHLELEISK